jgi:hypothetical protein
MMAKLSAMGALESGSSRKPRSPIPDAAVADSLASRSMLAHHRYSVGKVSACFRAFKDMSAVVVRVRRAR